MGLNASQLKTALDTLAQQETGFADALAHSGYPEPRHRNPGFETLLRTIIGQQVSVAAANSIWNRLETLLGDGCKPEQLLAQDFDSLRSCGLSRQKQRYARSLAERVVSGALPLGSLPADDEDAIRYLTQVNGIGRWSAEIYLLFAEGRSDVWPAGDLAVQEAVKRLLSLPERPAEKQTRALALDWSPHRGAAAVFAWHIYATGFEAI